LYASFLTRLWLVVLSSKTIKMALLSLLIRSMSRDSRANMNSWLTRSISASSDLPQPGIGSDDWCTTIETWLTVIRHLRHVNIILAMPKAKEIVQSGFLKAVSIFFEYDTPKIVHIRSKKVSFINSLTKAAILV